MGNFYFSFPISNKKDFPLESAAYFIQDDVYHFAGVKPPKIIPESVYTITNVFPTPSHFQWNLLELYPFQLPRYSNSTYLTSFYKNYCIKIQLSASSILESNNILLLSSFLQLANYQRILSIFFYCSIHFFLIPFSSIMFLVLASSQLIYILTLQDKFPSIQLDLPQFIRLTNLRMFQPSPYIQVNVINYSFYFDIFQIKSSQIFIIVSNAAIFSPEMLFLCYQILYKKYCVTLDEHLQWLLRIQSQVPSLQIKAVCLQCSLVQINMECLSLQQGTNSCRITRYFLYYMIAFLLKLYMTIMIKKMMKNIQISQIYLLHIIN